MTEKEIEAAFAQAVESYRAMPKGIRASTAIEALSQKKVIPVDLTNEADRDLISRLEDAAQRCMAGLIANPLICGRVNEVGNLFEPRTSAACVEAGLKVEPIGGPSGYPDLLVRDPQGRPTYIEVKAVGVGKEDSSFRSFYLSPSERPKVRYDARHILFAFVHEPVRNSEGIAGYCAKAFKLMDISRLLGSVKFEYQSNNRQMYGGELLASGKLIL